MLLNALTTYAAKSGVLSVSTGKVASTCSLTDLDADRQRLSMEFGGGTKVFYAPAGVVCHLRVPLAPLGGVGQEILEGHPF